MPFPVLFPCHIIASVFHVCPRVQYFVLRFRFYSLSFCHLEISHRKWPLPCQKTQHQSYTPLTWPTIHWTTKVHVSTSIFFCYTSISPPVCLFTCLCLFLQSLCQHVLFLSLSFFLFFLVSALLSYCAVSVADLKMHSLRSVCAPLFLMCVFLCSFECAVQ